MATVTKTVRLPGGQVINVKVDDLWTDEEIRDRLERKMGNVESSGVPFSREAYYKELNRNLSPVERFATAFDRGVTRLGEGLFQKEPPEVKAAAGDLTSNYASGMAGDIVGKAAPLLPLAAVGAPGTVAGRALPAATSTLGRIGAAGAAGALEGGLIAQSEGQNTFSGAGAGAAIGATAEAALPFLGRIAGKVYRSAFGTEPVGQLIDMAGQPTPALNAALRKAGMSFSDLTDEAVDFVARQSPGANPEQVARAARFKSQGIDGTQGMITQDFQQQAKEARLAEMLNDQTAEPLRQRLSEVSGQFTDAVEGFAGSMGSSRMAGESTKDALERSKELLRAKKNRAYNQAAKLAQEAGGIPVPTDDIAAAIPNDFRRRARALPKGDVKAFNELMVEFGIDQSPEAVEAFTKKGGRVIPLSIENAEEFRVALKDFGSGVGEYAPRWQSLTRGMLDAFDETLDDMSETLPGDVGKALKSARAANRTYKTEFSPQSLAGRMINTRPDGFTPVIEASQVMQQLRTRPVEQLQRTLSVMAKSGRKGQLAIKNMRAAVVLDALEQATKAPSNKYGGKQLANTAQFSKYLDQRFGRERLEMLFRGQGDALRQLDALMQTGLDIQPPAKAMPKGSAAVNMDVMRAFQQKIGPALYALATPVRAVVAAGVDRAGVNRALSPKVASEAQAFVSAYPRLAALTGIASSDAVAQNMKDEDKQ